MTADEANAALKEVLLAEIGGTRALLAETDRRYQDLLAAKLQGVIDLIKEKDALYTDRDTARQKAVEAALKAAQTGVDAAFAASEKAIGKSDQNAEKWRENANEWRSAMMDREIKFAARTETDNEFKSLRTELASLKESRATDKGKTDGISASWAVVLAVMGMLAAYGFLRPSAPVAPDPTLAAILTELKAQRAPAVPPVPQVIYVPAPAGTQLPVTPPGPAPR